MKSDSVIYVTPTLSSFVLQDINHLREKYHVEINYYNWSNKLRIPIIFISQLFYFLTRIRKVKSIIISFGGYWALIPSIIGKIFKVPVYIILNGTDSASIPSLNYGSLRFWMERNVCKFSYQLSKKLLPVSSSLLGTVNSYYSGQNKGEKFQGISYLLPKLKYDYKIIHNGFDSIFWTNKTNTSKLENSFTAVISPSQYYLKGGDLIIQLAELNSEYTFFLIGINKPPFIDDIPDNIIFLGRISHKEMREYFSKSRFHLQLSIFEGFGCSLCEAMLCECIPIGSNVNIIPEIIGNSGFILQHRDIDELNQLVRSAISGQDKEAKGLSARSRIISKYPIERRINSLVEIIEQ